MEHQGRGWTGLGKALLIAATSHGWVLLLGLVALIATTYIAAYILISAIKDQKSGGVVIITPFLTIRTQPLDHCNRQGSPGRLSESPKLILVRKAYAFLVE